MSSRYNAKLILAGDRNNLEIAPGAEVTFDAEHLGQQPFQPLRLEIKAPAGWLVLELRFQRVNELSAPVPAEMFAPDVWMPDMVLPVIRPGEHVELVMRNGGTATGKATARLLGTVW